MDADWSHDPTHLPELVAATEHADVAIGSRYVAGGAIDGWPRHRRIMSRADQRPQPHAAATADPRCERRRSAPIAWPSFATSISRRHSGNRLRLPGRNPLAPGPGRRPLRRSADHVSRAPRGPFEDHLGKRPANWRCCFACRAIRQVARVVKNVDGHRNPAYSEDGGIAVQQRAILRSGLRRSTMGINSCR